MSNRLVRVLVATSLALSIGFVGILISPAAQAQAAQAQAVQPQAVQAQAAGGGLSFSPAAMPLPAKGEAFRFSLCEGRVLAANDVSRPCTQGNSTTVTGGHPANYVFNTGQTFLPRGLTLDGFGVLSGKTDIDLSKVAIHVCVLQLNETASCQDLGFGNQAAQVKPKGPNTAAFAGVLGAVIGGGALAGYAAKKYQESLQSTGGSSGGSGGSCTTGQPASCTRSSQCSCGYRCVTFDGTGGVGFCAK